MKKNFSFLFLICLAVVANAQAPFTAGNIVVLRVGDGTNTLSNKGNALFLDEYNPITNVKVQSISLPTVTNGTNQPIVLSGTATSEGALTRSANGNFLTFAGYASAVGASTVSLSTTTGTAVPRVIAIIKSDASINTSKTLTNFASTNNPRGAYSNDGNSVWLVSGAKGLQYTTVNSTDSAIVISRITSTGTNITNLRTVNEFNGQLFVSTGSGSAVRVGIVGTGTGLPVDTGKVINPIPGLPIANPASPYAFFAAKVPSTAPISNVAYVADDNTNGAGGIKKYALNILTNTYDSVGVIDAGSVYRGLTGVVNGTTVTLYATRNSDSLVTITDNAAYNAAPSSSTYTLIAAAPTGTVFRGVALAPIPVLADNNFVLNATIENNAAKLNWSFSDISSLSNFTIEKSNDGRNFSTLAKEIVQSNIALTFTDDKFNNITSYYRVKANKINGSYSYSNIAVASAKTKSSDITIYPNPAQDFIVVNHSSINGDASLSLINAAGETVLVKQISKQTLQSYLSITNLSKGIYTVSIKCNNETISKQFIKQ